MTFFVCLWLLAARYIWNFSHDTFLVPIKSETFEVLYSALGNHRIVLSSWLMQPFLVFMTFLPSLLLLSAYYLIYLIAPSKRPFVRILMTLGACLFFFLQGAPGETAIPLFKLNVQLLLLLPLVVEPSLLRLWVIGTTLIVLSFAFEAIRFQAFWTLLSMLMAHGFSFIFGDKGVAPSAFRRQPVRALLTSFGLILFGVWALMSLMKVPIEPAWLSPSSHLYIPWVILILAGLMTLWYPWKLPRWLMIATFSQGVLFSSGLEQTCYFLMLWLFIHWACDFQYESLPGLKAIPRKIWIGLGLAPWAGILGSMIYFAFHFHPQTDFDPRWVSLVKKVSAEPTHRDGYVVVGSGLPFLSHFLHGNLVRMDESLEISSEEELAKLLENLEAHAIIVERKFVLHYWKEWMHEGKPADVSNLSIISRILSYDGKEIKTRTLSIPAIEKFQKKEWEGAPGFTLITLGSPAAAE